MICVRCIVSGRVQGVWFRETTRQKAARLGILALRSTGVTAPWR